jgi:hypothetical protein
MNRLARLLVALTLIAGAAPLASGDSIDSIAENSKKLYEVGSGAHDGATTALGASMLGWGIGLAVAIALLAAFLNHSSGSHAHTHCH